MTPTRLENRAEVYRIYTKFRDRETPMCRNIKTLANFEPPATEDEIRASALQFVRKLSGSTAPRTRTKRRSTGRR